MSGESDGNRNLPVEVRSAIRKEAIGQTAKWAIGVSIAVTGFALAGWWFYLEPKLKSYIADAAGGVPAGGIIISNKECSKMAGGWSTFKEGTGRFIVGAGTETIGFYSNWENTGGFKKKLTLYELMQPGGEEYHLIKAGDLPDLNVEMQEYSGHGGHAAKWVSYKDRPDQGSIKLFPPYIALNYCIKQ